MKVGTDGVLLGAWADPGGAARILDVGTGTGLVALMLAQRSEARIDAVEIDPAAADQAAENVWESPWGHRISVYNEAFQHFAGGTDMRYDMIVSNPPYFRNALQPHDAARAGARHDTRLSFAGLLSGADRLLPAVGRLCVILPAPAYEAFTGEAWFHRLYPSKCLWIRSVPGKEMSRCLLELARTAVPAPVEQELVLRESDGRSLSEGYRALTREFYL
jgi:tRNA1Val (adenine37-N6)-methyltransferase